MIKGNKYINNWTIRYYSIYAAPKVFLILKMYDVLIRVRNFYNFCEMVWGWERLVGS